MKKRIAIVFLAAIVSFLHIMPCLADLSEIGEDAFFITSIPFESEDEYNFSKVIKARFKDTKEPVALSKAYSGRVYAALPYFSAEREIEAFETTPLSFSDYDASKYEFHVFEELSRVGVIKGNEKGEARPFDNITRAEAAAMLMRCIGLENLPEVQTTVNFTDVSKNDWFYSTVMSAYSFGIINGTSADTFEPYRNVTREEFTVMTARAVDMLKLGYPGGDNINAPDAEKISDWAVRAYEMLGNYVATDYDATNPDMPVRVINPQKYATRYDVAELLHNVSERCTIYPSMVAESFGFNKGMPVIDGSTSTYPFTEAVYEMLFSNGANHPAKPVKHSKSHETYTKLINGEIDMMFASVYPASDILNMAKEKGVELELIPIAYDAMIFFTNAENTAEGLTSQQISNIYVNNAYENWNQIGGPDALLYPYCRNNDSGSHAQMEKHFLFGNEIHEKIRAESTSVAMASVLTDVIGAKTEEPAGYALGYSIYYYYHNADMVLDTKRHLKLLSVDGVYPTDETIADGSYPLSNNTYVVMRKDTPKDSPARKMAEFMLTPEGQMCVEAAGFGKLSEKAIEESRKLCEK